MLTSTASAASNFATKSQTILVTEGFRPKEGEPERRGRWWRRMPQVVWLSLRLSVIQTSRVKLGPVDSAPWVQYGTVGRNDAHRNLVVRAHQDCHAVPGLLANRLAVEGMKLSDVKISHWA
jgi:hypothetical protein